MADTRNRILLVDDKLESVEFVAIELRRAGYEVVETASGAAALESVRNQSPDLVLLDVMMPEIGGHEVCRRLKSNPATEHIPVVMMTALNDRENKLQALRNGANDFLTKPTDRAELLARVSTLLRSKQLHDELAASLDAKDAVVQELNHIIERLKALAELSRAIVSNLDSDQVLTGIVTRAVQLSGFDAGIIREYQSATETLSYRASYGVSRQMVDMLQAPASDPAPTHFGILDYVIRTRQPVQLADVEELAPGEQGVQKEIGFAPRLELWRSAGIRSVLALPLATDQVVGVLILHRRRPGAIADTTLKMLQTFAAQSAVAIQNARLFKSLDQERAAIERERQTLFAIMAGITDGLLVIDAEKRVRYCNAKAAEWLGLEDSSVVNEPLGSVLAQLATKLSGQSASIEALNAALRCASERPTLELEITGAPTRNLLAFVFPISASDVEIDTGVLLHDVTRERELVRTKDELLSVVSHELRTPLASLVGFAELLLERQYGEEQRREFLTVMYEEGRRLTALINDFLDLQRLESGRQSVHLQPLAIGPLLRHAVSTAGEDPARPLVLDLPNDIPEVDVDPDRLQQVLGNLFSNARKYSPAGGEIRVSVEVSDGGVKVLVRDSGLGLPPEALPQLFQKFYRVDNSDRRKITGTGLGLAICRQIIAEHGGTVGAHSEGLGKGSCFWFTLSLAKPTRQAGDVLIVEDDVGFSRLVEAELSNRGFTSVRAPNAGSALKVLRSTKPKAIVLDLLLPDVPGEELLASLAHEPNRDIPVVIATVKELTSAEREQLEQLGAVTVITKGPRVASLIGAEVAQLVAPVELAAPA